MESSEILHTIEALHRDAHRRRLFFQNATGARLEGRRVTINGSDLLSFGSCSYLGLEFHPDLVEGACDAARRYGTQFSCSRGYLSAPLYEELEEAFCKIFDAHVIVAPTTTLGHLAAFDALMTEKDAIVLDHQVHQSVHTAANTARAHGVRVSMVRHEELEKAEEEIARLAKTHRTVWFCADGVLSMYGDLAPFDLLRRLLAVSPRVRLYIDDAHGMSWKGIHGRGSFLSAMPLDERIVVATSLAKAFGCGGGLLVFRSPEERERVQMCGGPLLFSGPLQPPMIGAALASAGLHLTDEITQLQEALRERVRYSNARLRDEGLPLLVENDVPIRFIRLGLPRVANEVAQRVASDGLYVNVSMYPTVPMRRAGIRLSINTLHSHEDIDRLVASLGRHVPAVLADERLSLEDLDALFAKAVVGPTAAQPAPAPESSAVLWGGLEQCLPKGAAGASATSDTWPVAALRGELRVEHLRSVRALDRAEWDHMLGQAGMCSAAAMELCERVYTGQPSPQHNWAFDYVIVRDSAGKRVCATVFTTALQKDDFLMRDAVSREVERRRESDPLFLTSRVVMSGSTLSEGHHVFIDREGPWRSGLRLLLEAAQQIHERERADVIMLREMPDGDPEMDGFMLEQGFVGVPTLDSHQLSLDFRDLDEFAARLSKYKRQDLRTQAKRAEHFVVEGWGVGSAEGRPMAAEGAWHLHELYMNLARRKFRINIFPLHGGVLEAMLESPAWELVTLRLRPEAGGPAHGRPVAWFAGHMCEGHYGALVVGLDYEYVLEHGVYRQMIFQMIERARFRGMRTLHLGMDADVEKARYRTTLVKNRVYVQAREHYNAALLRQIVADVGSSVA